MDNKDVQRVWTAFLKKKPRYDELWDYYDGNHPLKYSSSKLEKVFEDIDARFIENWTGVVVDAMNDRLIFSGVHIDGDPDRSRAAQQIVDDLSLSDDIESAELCALVTGEGFLVISWDEGVNAFYNDSREVHVIYRADNPKTMKLAAKRWIDDDDFFRLTLYYPEKIEYYRSSKKHVDMLGADSYTHFNPYPSALDLGVVSESGSDQLMATADNPLKTIPVVHFRRETRAIKSEIGPSILDMQDAVNKLLNDMMVISESAAFRQRYVISNASGIGNLKNGPNIVWDLPAGDGTGGETRVGEFAESSLADLVTAMEKKAATIGRMSRTPASYFFLGARSDPSGEALIAMEAPLVAKCHKFIGRMKRDLCNAFALILPLAGVPVDKSQIKITYEDPRTIQPLTQAQARQANTTSGIPLTTQLKSEGWTQTELNELEQDKQAEEAAASASLADALMRQQRSFDTEGGQDE